MVLFIGHVQGCFEVLRAEGYYGLQSYASIVSLLVLGFVGVYFGYDTYKNFNELSLIRRTLWMWDILYSLCIAYACADGVFLFLENPIIHTPLSFEEYDSSKNYQLFLQLNWITNYLLMFLLNIVSLKKFLMFSKPLWPYTANVIKNLSEQEQAIVDAMIENEKEEKILSARLRTRSTEDIDCDEHEEILAE